MASCTDTSNRWTTLLSATPLRPVVGAALRPVLAPRPQGADAATSPRGWRAACVAPDFGGFQGAAMAPTGQAAAIDLMVTDHKYSTRLGSSSCSPPV
jgi:hypothetical protein